MRLVVDSLSRRFGAVQALDGVSFAVEPGEVVGLIGPNGAGKSTLLACAAGLDVADSGTILVDGAPFDHLARRGICFFLQDSIRPFERQNGVFVLDFARKLFGASEEWRDDIGPALGIAPFVHQRIGEMSKGQRKRVLLALALLVPRPFTLIDEPFDGLDPRQARAFGDLVRARAAIGRAFVLSVHAMSDATRTCDRHVLLHDGRVLASGSLSALRTAASLGESATLEDVFLALT